MTQAATWQTVIDTLDAACPDAGRLARLASLAVRVEPRLLRRLRLRFLPRADASTEADVWFSALVAVRDARAFRWAPGAPDVLRATLSEVEGVDLGELRDQIAELHRGAPPLVQLEEEIAWLALRNAPRSEIEAALGRVLRALQDQPGRADDLAAWAVHALPDLPEAARSTAAAWQLRMTAASRFGNAPAMGVPAPDDLLAQVARGVLADRGRERLRVVRDADRLWLDPAPAATDSDPDVLTVPSTRPLWLEVSSDGGRRRRVLAVEPGRRTPLDATGGDVLRNALGDAWVLESARIAQLGATPETDAGEVLFGWLVVRIPAGDRQGWDSVRQDVLADAARAAHRVGSIGMIIVLAHGVPPEQGSVLAGLDGQFREALQLRSTVTRLWLSPVPASQDGGGGSREPVNNTAVIEYTPVEGVHVVVRTDDRPSAWLEFSDRVLAAMLGADSTTAPARLVVAIGRDAARLAERRFPVTVPLLILDDASPWALPLPGVRVVGPPPLWGASAAIRTDEAVLRDAGYALGCVRTVSPPTEESPPAAFLATVERVRVAGEWHERTTRSPVFDLHYLGDRDLGWNRNQYAIVLGDPGRDRFVAALREWWDGAGNAHAGFLAISGGSTVRSVLETLPRRELTRVWLFAREDARREDVEMVVRQLGAVELIGFVDRRELADPLAVSATGPAWFAFPTGESRETSPPVTAAGLEVLLGAGQQDGSIHVSDLRAHMSTRRRDATEFREGSYAERRPPRKDPAAQAAKHARDETSAGEDGGERSGSLGDGPVAPAPKRARVDTSAIRTIFGGESRGDREDFPIDEQRTRVVFVTGRDAPARSAWLDRWLRRWIDPAVDDHPPAMFGCTPSRQSDDALLLHVRSVLIDWSSPPTPLDAASEIAWRIEGSHAVFVLDGLGAEARPFESKLIESCALNGAGLLVVTTPHVGGWMANVPSAMVIDLDHRADEAEPIRRAAFQPAVGAWIEQLASHGHDQPVAAAIRLAHAAYGANEDPASSITMHALDAWLRDGDARGLQSSELAPTALPAERIARLAYEAVGALVDGDTERMLARVRDAVELAIATLGADACAKMFGGGAAETPEIDGPSIRITEGAGRYQIIGRSDARATALHAAVDARAGVDPAALRALAPVVQISRSQPVALDLPRSSDANALPWEHLLIQATAAPGERALPRRAQLFRTTGATAPGSPAIQLRWTAELLSIVGAESHGDSIRAAFQRHARDGAGLVVNIGGRQLAPSEHRGWNLHVLGAPAGGTQVRLQPDFVARGSAGSVIDLRALVEQIHPQVLILQDLPTTTLAHSLQGRQRAENLRSLAAPLADLVPFMVVVPAVEHDHAPRILRLLFDALAATGPAALIAAAARARALILDRSSGNDSASADLAGDLVVWAPRPPPPEASPHLGGSMGPP